MESSGGGSNQQINPKAGAAERPKGHGSIWNNNSWFFEEKNYTRFAKDYLKQELCKLSV